jgi:hypothetical protein
MCFLQGNIRAQMPVGTDTLYGNEWTQEEQRCLKIKVARTGVYRIGVPELAAAGLPPGTNGSQLRLFSLGRPRPLYVSQAGSLAATDFVEFYGNPNEGTLDRYLFEQPATQQVNPEYSLFNDTAVYYLVWNRTDVTANFLQAVPNDPTNLPAAAPWCRSTVRQVFSGTHVQREVLNYINYSLFVGNGFAGEATTQSVRSLDLPDIVATAPAALASVRYTSPAFGLHKTEVSWFDSLYHQHEFTGWRVQEDSFSLPAARLRPVVPLKVQSLAGGSDYHHLAFASIRYGRGFQFDMKEGMFFFEMEPAGQSEYIEIKPHNLQGNRAILYDLTTRTRMEATADNNGLLRFALSPSGTLRQCVLVSSNNGWQKAAVHPVATRFEDWRKAQANYVIVSARSLRGGTDPVAAYAAYRSSDAGGRYRVLTVNIEDITDQFGYGVDFQPIALRNFLQYYKKHVPALSHVLVIGKGLDYNIFRTSTDQKQYADSLFFVPSFGAPASDWPFAMHSNGLSEPLFAIGRIPVSQPAEIEYYLEKVKTHDAQRAGAGQSVAERAWMRRVLHNSGGATGSGENQIIRSYTTGMAQVLSNSRFGADVTSFYKTSNDPIQVAAFDKMLTEVNKGVALWTIFGHSSAYFVDFEIGLVENYDNRDRYPMMMVLGCYAGSCSNNLKGLGEQFLLAPRRGAIAYTGTTSAGYISDLNTYARQFYDLLGNKEYGQTLGQQMRRNIADTYRNAGVGMAGVLHQGLLQGDPALRLYPHPGPDYLIDEQSVRVHPAPANTGAATVHLSFDLVNIGRNDGDKVALRIEQRLPDGRVVLRLTDSVQTAPYRTALQYEVPVANTPTGFSRFLITVDPLNRIAELPAAAEQNNELTLASGEKGVEVYFYSDDVQPVFPEDFGIVGREKVTLYASTVNPTAPEQFYQMEMDTTEHFSSPFLLKHRFQASGGLLSWQPDRLLQPEKVYYWRIARDSLVDGALLWRTRSFVHLKTGEQGWNQSHYGQFKTGVLSNLRADEARRTLEFTDNTGYFSCQLAYLGVERFPSLQNAFYEGVVGDWGWGIREAGQGVGLIVINPASGRLVVNPANGPYSHSTRQDMTAFYFNTADPQKRRLLMDFIENAIPDGYYAALMTLTRFDDPTGFAPLQWAADSITYGKNLFSVLERQGARQVREVLNFDKIPRPYGLLFQKGNPAFAKDTLLDSPNEAILLNTSIPGRWTEGLFETQAVGPVKAWKRLLWDTDTPDAPTDYAALQVVGVRPPLPDTVLLTLTTDRTYDLGILNVDAFPQLKLRYETRDTARRTMTPARYLRILYDPLPEGALHPAQQFVFHKDTLQQGENLWQRMAFVNVSEVPMDSLTVQYRVESQSGGVVPYNVKTTPLAPGATAVLAFSLPTASLAGACRLTTEVNPPPGQPERYHFNNVRIQPFYVGRDTRNPLLDVTFDGVHLMNGDIVSPQPEIVALLKDDNHYLALTDTALFQLTLERPDGSRQIIPFNHPALTFFPADTTRLDKKNTARMEWRPVFTENGEYRLLVNGRDASGNKSGLDYAIRFRVITKSSISNLLNYPNPFSTQTCFVYTMTGAETPAHFKVQIMTVSGRIVREITEQEFGPLRAGTHRSNYCWDGRDEYGDQLANGVYLYRIVAKKADGTPFEFFENTGIDGMFQHGYGKMMLMR